MRRILSTTAMACCLCLNPTCGSRTVGEAQRQQRAPLEDSFHTESTVPAELPPSAEIGINMETQSEHKLSSTLESSLRNIPDGALAWPVPSGRRIPVQKLDKHRSSQAEEPRKLEHSEWFELSQIAPQPRIIGGKSTSPTRHPFVASLQINGFHICGGSLVAWNMVLSAAHCAGLFDRVVIGRYDLSDNQQGREYRIEKLMLHPGFQPSTFQNDFMLVKLIEDVRDPSVHLVQLNRDSSVPDLWQDPPNFVVLGWGDVDPNDEVLTTSDTLLEATVTFLRSNDCEDSDGFFPSQDDPNSLLWGTYRGKIDDSMICAFNIAVDSCQGDSGGPLLLQAYDRSEENDSEYGGYGDVLFGSVSWGFGCQHPDFPGVYGRVSAAAEWIDTVICAETDNPPSSINCSSGESTNFEIVNLSENSKTTSYSPTDTPTIAPTIDEWPNYVTLQITFDNSPFEISWKLENARTRTTLASKRFGDYDETMVGQTVEEHIGILTAEDYEGDWTSAMDLREYYFVIYDRGGNGLCCSNGSGHYELFAQGRLMFTGNSFAASKEHFFSINPAEYAFSPQTNSDVLGPPMEPPDPTTPTKGPTIWPTNKPTTAKPTLVPPDQQTFFCGHTFEDAEDNCHLPCPTGSPASCPDVGHTCYASTTCRERWPTYFPTGFPSANPTGFPTVFPSLAPSAKSSMRPSMSPTSTSKPTILPTSRPTRPPTLKPTIHVQTIDQNKWFCGESWDWVTANCDLATPCPNGDPEECPSETQACFASTPCTKNPTLSPTLNPTDTPSISPTYLPTKAPWGEKAFLDFLYADKDDTNDKEKYDDKDGPLASDVNDALANYDNLQYHFFCGYNWYHADATCNMFCPSGDRTDCPDGMQCYANTRCDGRDTPPPTTSPAPSSFDSRGERCTVCMKSNMDNSLTVKYKDIITTCGDINWTLSKQNVVAGSDLCDFIQDEYRDQCCYDECQLCRTNQGGYLDLRIDHVVEHGGFSATCEEIKNILSFTDKNDKTCLDARAQLVEECCYEQCTLCGNSPGATTEWYATVSFKGMTTTCLGLDYMLRIEQIGVGHDRCSDIRDMYSDDCCDNSPSDPCQLCEVDDVLYEVDSTKTVTIGRASIPCVEMNESFTRMESNAPECFSGKQSLFGNCCDVTSVVLLEDLELNDGSSPGGLAVDDAEETVEGQAAGETLSPSGEIPSPSPGMPNPPKGPEGPSPAPVTSVDRGEGGEDGGKQWWVSTAAPTVAHFWGGQEYSFNWNPTDGVAREGMVGYGAVVVWSILMIWHLLIE